MTDPAIKTALALCVILVGVCAATLFRNDKPVPVVPDVAIDEAVLLRYRAEASARAARAKKSAGQAATTQAVKKPLATVVTPLDRMEPPPALPEKYPEPLRRPSPRPGASIEMMLPSATHRVIDGDTLAALAERYLGSASRAEEFFSANSDILRDPRVLPIGVELKIPPRDNGAAAAK